MRIRSLGWPFLHVFVLLHHLFVFCLFFLSLFGSQQGKGIPLRLDDGHSESELVVQALFDLRFDGRNIRLFIFDQGLMLPLRDQNVRFRFDPGAIQIEFHVLQLRHLLVAQADLLLMLDQVAKKMAGAAMHHAHLMATHWTMTAAPVPFLAVAWLIGPTP